MVRRRAVLLPLLAGAAAVALPAEAAPPKPFTKTVVFVDSTPDPSAYFLGPEHCLGQLPREEPVRVDVPAAGTMKIDISGFTGEWSLIVFDGKGNVIGVADADAPATESLTMRVKKAGPVDVLPCNLFGTFEASLTYSWAPKR